MKFSFTKRLSCFRISAGLGALCLVLVSFAGFGQARYTWQPVANNSWSNALNWLPARAFPAASDILVFDGSLTPTATINVDFDVSTSASQSIGQLLLINGVQASLSTDADRTLAIGALAPATGLQIGAGARVQVIGTQGSNSALSIKLASNVRGSIAGRLEFLGTATVTSSSTHVLTSSTAGAIEFMNGSYFLTGLKFGGNPFGSAKGSTGSVIFHAGATCEQSSGASPFGGNTYDVANFEAGSLFLYTSNGSNEIGLAGHTFGYLTLNTTRSSVNTTYSAEKVSILNDLVISGGAHTIDVGQLELKGNLYLNGGSLGFVPVATNSLALSLNGTVLQAIGGTVVGTLMLGPNVALTLNNPAGVALQRPLLVNGSLALAQGLLTTTATNSLTLGPAATASGNATSFVNGPLTRQLAATAATDLLFPIGSGAAYRPLTLRATQTDANLTSYTAQQFNQAPAGRTYPSAAGSLQRVSKVRYFNVTNGGATNFAQGTITLSYDIDDRVDAPAKLRLAKSDNAGNWLDLGGTGTGAPAGSITSTVPFASFSDFVLASTEANGTPGNNPLPVVLTGFTAQRQAAGVYLHWATASELNNSRFEVQRSTDGQTFATLKTVPGHGTSTAAQAYDWLDADPSSGPLYYRLRQVDAGGAEACSPVVAVLPDAAQTGVFPNPAHQHISFGAPAGSMYRVLNGLGQPVLAGRTDTGLNTLTLTDLVPGIYCLEITSAQGRVRYRFAKGDGN